MDDATGEESGTSIIYQPKYAARVNRLLRSYGMGTVPEPGNAGSDVNTIRFDDVWAAIDAHEQEMIKKHGLYYRPPEEDMGIEEKFQAKIDDLAAGSNFKFNQQGERIENKCNRGLYDSVHYNKGSKINPNVDDVLRVLLELFSI